MKKDQTPTSKLIMENVYLLKNERDEETIIKLEEYGLIEAQGKKKRRFKKFTDRGIKRALALSVGLTESEKERG